MSTSGLSSTEMSENRGFDELNLGMDIAMIDYLKKMVKENKNVLKKGNEYLEQTQKRWSEYPDFGEGEKISVAEYLERNPHVLKKCEVLKKSFNGVSFEQKTRKSNLSETRFLEEIREIGDGMFFEVIMVIATLSNGSTIKKLAFSSNANEVDQESINNAISDLKTAVGEKQIAKVDLVHNHPDMYAKTKMWSIQEPDEDGYDVEMGLIGNNSLTDRDIRTADMIAQDNFSNIPVNMIAISESGFTFLYEANTAKYKDK